jgi:tetratricopeptide (TPR) repeat protein
MGLRGRFASLRARVASPATAAEPASLPVARAATAAKDWPAAAVAWRQVAEDPAATPLGAEPWAELSRARRLMRDLDGALGAVELGRAQAPGDVLLAVEHARIALRGYAASEEDERHRWKAALLAARTDLRTAREAGATSKPALQTAGDIELVLRRWQDAVDLFEELARRYPDRRDLAAVRRAEALRRAGDLVGARAALDELSAEAAADEQALLLADAVTAGEQVAAANAAMVRASVRWRAGEPGVLRAELPRALVGRGHPEDRVERTLPLLDDLEAFLAAPEETPPPPVPDPTHLIGGARDAVVVSGFLYSGSGAVFDLLRGLEGYHLPFGDRETGFLKKPGHLATILEDVTADRVPEPATVADAVLASTFGFGQTGRPLVRWSTGDDGYVDRLVAQLRWLVAELRRVRSEGGGREQARHDAEHALRRFLDAYLADRTPVGTVALLNNAIIGHELHRIRLLSGGVAVPVLRDPRDQFVSQQLESPFAMGCADFVAMMRERYAALATSLADPELASRLVPVRFERFVTDESHRRALLERLGVAADGPLPRTFRPERSRENVGIHRSHGDRHEVERVAATLLGPFEELVGAW